MANNERMRDKFQRLLLLLFAVHHNSTRITFAFYFYTPVGGRKAPEGYLKRCSGGAEAESPACVQKNHWARLMNGW